MLDLGTQDFGHWTFNRSCFVLTMGRPFPNLCMLSKKHGKSIWDPDVENWTLQSIGDCIDLKNISGNIVLTIEPWEVEILLWRIYLKKVKYWWVGGGDILILSIIGSGGDWELWLHNGRPQVCLERWKDLGENVPGRLLAAVHRPGSQVTFHPLS